MDLNLPQLTKSTRSYIRNEDGSIFQTIDKMAYNEDHLPSDDFLSFMNVQSYKISSTTSKELVEVMTPQRETHKTSERKTDEPQKRYTSLEKKPDI